MGFLEMQKRRRKETRPPTVSFDQMSQWEQDEIDPGYWEELLTMVPDEVCRRTLASYDRQKEVYQITLLNQGYTIHPFRRSIVRETGAPAPSHRHDNISFSEALVLVIYLLRAKDIPPVGTQQTEKDLPGGETFFRGPHALPRQPILRRFGHNPQGFSRAAISLGGERLDYGDAAFRFQTLPRVPLDTILWVEDEEFPASLTFAFDPTVANHLPLDVIWALVHLVTRRLLEAAPEAP
jgi:hypothetical protein